MINAILRGALQSRLMVIVAAVLLMIFGVWTTLRLPVDVFPDLNRPTVTILTEAPGLAPEEVEALVTRPIETAMNGAPGVERVRSSSAVGLSITYVEFAWGTDIYRDRQLVTERLQLVRETIPASAEPTIGPISSIMGEIMLIGVESPNGTVLPFDLRTTAEQVIGRRVLTIAGVSQVIAIGGGLKQYVVQPSPELLAAVNLSLEDIVAAVEQASINTSGGFVSQGGRELVVRNFGRTVDLDELAATPVGTFPNGVPIPLSTVAKISIGTAPKRGDAGVDGKPAVILMVQKQPGTDTVKLTRRIEEALAQLEGSLPPDVRTRVLFRQATFIDAAIHNVEAALRDGAILVTIVLFIFLLNFRTTAITLTAIPLSLVVTVIVMKLFGQTINTMTLGGVAIAMGELVDDAIVDVENVFRRLRENRALGNPKPVLQIVFDASSEVRTSIVYATILVILVFLPLFALSGIEGRLFAPLGLAYVIAILASFVVSITVTPALCAVLLPKARAMERGDGAFVRWLKGIDERLLRRVLRHPKPVIAATALAVVGAIAIVPFLGREFLPPFNEGTATVNVLARPGTSLDESNRIGAMAERLMLEVPEVVSVGRRTGRAERDEHAEGVHYSEIDVDFKPSRRSREVILADLRDRLSVLSGMSVSVGQPISHRLDHLLSGVRAQIAIKVFGTDLATLRQKAGEVQAAVADIPGLVDLQTERQVLVPQLQVRVNRERAALYGLQAGSLNQWLETALAGRVVGQILEGQFGYDLVVRLPEELRARPEPIRNLLVDTPSGAKVPLHAVADVQETWGPNLIQHEDVQRRIVVSANVAGRDLGAVVADIETRVKERVSVPAGYYITYGGQFESQRSASRTLALLSILSFAAMFTVLYAHFRSTRIVLQILINIPIALIGAVLAVLLTGGVFSIASMVGFITLTGIASRNTIMMISHYLHLMQHEGEQFTESMVIRGSLERLVPVLMTALTAGLALVPLALSKGEPGKEILYPVATVILGGLLTTTILDMFVTPAAFWLFGRPAAEKSLAERDHPAKDAA
ncbi:MAG: efflux RND transporter permease subunit [Candidatus Eisenbacteria bacterium]